MISPDILLVPLHLLILIVFVPLPFLQPVHLCVLKWLPPKIRLNYRKAPWVMRLKYQGLALSPSLNSCYFWGLWSVRCSYYGKDENCCSKLSVSGRVSHQQIQEWGMSVMSYWLHITSVHRVLKEVCSLM